jgi:hypothetical protein
MALLERQAKPPCGFTGNGDMYGLGIRLGFYLQWYGAVFADWIAPSEVPSLRLTIAIFIAANFLALLLIRNSLATVETYIIFLLYFGSTLYILPVLFWRLVVGSATGCNPYYDATLWFKSERQTMEYNLLNSLLILATLSFMIWYWTTRVPALDSFPCQQFGFMFTKVDLNSNTFRIFNLVFVTLLVAAIYILLVIRLVRGENPDGSAHPDHEEPEAPELQERR